MTFHRVAAAAVLVLGAGASHAASLGTLNPSASFANTVTGAFTDSWTFDLSAPSVIGASVTNVEIFLNGLANGGIQGFSATLNGVPLGLTTTPGGAAPVQTVTQVLAGNTNTFLAKGAHELVVSGTGITGASASYGGNIVATPVPEPETYAMMLAGIGAIAFLLRRRRPD